MPLDATRLSAALRAALLANPDTQAVDNDSLTAVCDVIASTVLAEITANGQVLPGTFATSPSGGPVLGIAIIT